MPQAVGHIAQVVGPVVDVHFNISAREAENELPRINDALKVARPDGREVVLEVQQHIGEDTVRAVALDSTDGLSRGLEVVNTFQPVTMPVGTQIRGRVAAGRICSIKTQLHLFPGNTLAEEAQGTNRFTQQMQTIMYSAWRSNQIQLIHMELSKQIRPDAAA